MNLTSMSVRRLLAERLESSRPRGLPGQAAAWVFAQLAASRVARPLRLPSGVRVIGVGSAVIGGAGKTPVALAWARHLAAQGLRVAVVAHAYRAFPGRARSVQPDDPVGEVGDDALVLASSLLPFGAEVFVAPQRQAAIDLAASHAEILVVDGLLQTRPERLSQSLLVLDGPCPWGSGVRLPAGDLRAAPGILLALADRVVVLEDPAQQGPLVEFPGAIRAVLRFDTVRAGHRTERLQDLTQARLGLLLLVARPRRIEASLKARGIVPLCRWFGGDHASPGLLDRRALERMARRHRLDGWLVTPKCATHLSLGVGAPLWTMEATVRLDPRPPTVVDSGPCAPQTFSMHC
jgi:tetraacyldisaccharide 4'-kinase